MTTDTTTINITVRATLAGTEFWSTNLAVGDGEVVNAAMDSAIGTLVAQRDKLQAFVEMCSRKGGLMVDGNRLAIAANELLGRGAVVERKKADDTEGGEA